MKTFLPFILCFLLIACKPLDMSSVEGVNFYPYAEDSTQERISLFPLLPEGTKQEYYQYLNFIYCYLEQIFYKGRIWI